jgi:hypothetical protein
MHSAYCSQCDSMSVRRLATLYCSVNLSGREWERLMKEGFCYLWNYGCVIKIFVLNIVLAERRLTSRRIICEVWRQIESYHYNKCYKLTVWVYRVVKGSLVGWYVCTDLCLEVKRIRSAAFKQRWKLVHTRPYFVQNRYITCFSVNVHVNTEFL